MLFNKFSIRMLIALCLFITFTYTSSSNIFPNGGADGIERRQNSNCYISWNTATFTGGHVNIYLWNADTGSLSTIATNIDDTLGIYEWSIPVNQPTGNKFKIKVFSVEDSIFLFSNNFFEILPEEQEIILTKKDEPNLNNMVRVFPNPVNSNHIKIISDYLEIKSVRIWDFNGKLLTQQDINSLKNVDMPINILNNGIYMVELHFINDKTVYKKLVVAR